MIKFQLASKIEWAKITQLGRVYMNSEQHMCHDEPRCGDTSRSTALHGECSIEQIRYCGPWNIMTSQKNTMRLG